MSTNEPPASAPFEGPPAPSPIGTPSAPPASGGAAIPLMRRDQNKIVAGVCSGVAYRLGIDPNVVRVVAVVLTIFGGVGILLYALGWLLMPEQSTGRSLAERALRGGGPDGTSTVLLALGLAAVVLGFGFAVVGDSWFGLTVLALTLGLGAVLLSRRPGSGSVPVAAAPPGAGAQPSPVSPPGEAYSWAPPMYPAAGPAQPTLAPGSAPPGLGFAPEDAWYQPGYPYGPTVDSLDTLDPSPPAPRRPRSVLGPLTFFAALATLGVLGVVDALGASLSFAAYVAAALGVVGLGLVVGAWFGRSRGLIVLGVALAVLLVPAATVERLGVNEAAGEPFESVFVSPDSANEVDAVYEHGAGDITYDFTELDFVDRTVDTEIRVGAGSLVVDVPADVTLVVDAEVGAGQVDLDGQQSNGLGVSQDRTYEGAADAGTLRLDVRMGFGNVEVNRENA